MPTRSNRRTNSDGPPGVPRPTGKGAPTEPPKVVDPAVQTAMEQVRPAPGYALVRLLTSEQRTTELGLPADTTALLEAAMLAIVSLHPSDDDFARDVPVGSIIFASLEGLAPLLGSRTFLLPLERLQGVWPGASTRPQAPLGFEA
ncbi:MAG: hypothetical protein JWM90_2339 [Thermoleophilia bacterium]|nr:hypothetical protein [Thermoleophilia bacterium]